MKFDYTPQRLFAMDHLRLRALWTVLGVLLVVAVIVASLIDLGPPGAFSVNDKIMHTVVYAGLMGWFSQLFRHDLTRLLLALGFTTLGVGVEFLQAMVPHRAFDLLDMLANGSGVLLAWALAYTRVGEILPAVERVLIRLRGRLRRVASV